jgi:hypothetical protein
MTNPRLYISVTFWGELYRRYFLDYCLASLLAPGNIPAIDDKAAARLLIATPEADWQALQAEPAFQAAQRLIPIEHVPHPLDSAEMTREQVMRAMSRGHRALAERMFEDRAQGIFVYPDMILADGTLARLQELARSGAKLVMCLAVRFGNDGLIEELQQRGLVGDGRPLVLSPQELARLSISHMHSETRRFEFDGMAYDYGSSAFFWVVKPGEDVLFHTGNWAPMLIDYGAILAHDTSALDTWTLDGDYIHRNFPNSADVYVVQDTRDIFVSGFTREEQIHYSQAPFLPYRFGWLRETLKIQLAHQFLYSRKFLDASKTDYLHRPIRLRGGDSAESEWRRVEAQAAAVMRRIEGRNPALPARLAHRAFHALFKTVKLAKSVRRLVQG